MPKRRRDDRLKAVGEEVDAARQQASTSARLATVASDDLFFTDAGECHRLARCTVAAAALSKFH
jgi:hypothetical protein